MKKEIFNYSNVPYAFGLCAATDCPHAGTCLRRIAYEHAPADILFPPTLNPNAIEITKDKCKYYCSNEKVRYAKGFVRTTEALSVSASRTFRTRLIGSWGFRRYYQRRKGETLLSPVEQKQVVTLAKKLGLQQAEYFDNYTEEYKWG